MKTKTYGPIHRPAASRVLASTRETSEEKFRLLDPGRRMEAAFRLSVEARRLFVAGLKTQGFSEAEAKAVQSTRPPR